MPSCIYTNPQGFTYKINSTLLTPAVTKYPCDIRIRNAWNSQASSRLTSYPMINPSQWNVTSTINATYQGDTVYSTSIVGYETASALAGLPQGAEVKCTASAQPYSRVGFILSGFSGSSIGATDRYTFTASGIVTAGNPQLMIYLTPNEYVASGLPWYRHDAGGAITTSVITGAYSFNAKTNNADYPRRFSSYHLYSADSAFPTATSTSWIPNKTAYRFNFTNTSVEYPVYKPEASGYLDGAYTRPDWRGWYQMASTTASMITASVFGSSFDTSYQGQSFGPSTAGVALVDPNQLVQIKVRYNYDTHYSSYNDTNVPTSIGGITSRVLAP